MAKTERKEREWLVITLTEEDRREALLRLEDAEMTRVPPVAPFLIGALLAVVVVLALALASL